MLDEVLKDVTYPGVTFLTGGHAAPYLQVEFTGKCSVSGETMPWKGRKWRISVHMTRSEIVQTALKAVLTALEHEARESFKYRGQSIFDPHYDVDKLVELRAQPNALETRNG